MYFPAGDGIEHSQIIDPKLEVGQLRRAPQWEPVARTNGGVIFFHANVFVLSRRTIFFALGLNGGCGDAKLLHLPAQRADMRLDVGIEVDDLDEFFLCLREARKGIAH